MSILALSMALEQTIGDPLAKFILMLLADRHNADTNECFPSIARLCQDSELSRSTVIRKIELLEAAGLVETVERRRRDGTRTSNAYVLQFLPALRREEKPTRSKKRQLPADDWWPCAKTVQSLRSKYPHHDLGDDEIAYYVREFVNFCHAKDVRYAEIDRAFHNSVERQLRHKSARSSPQTPGPRKRSGAGSLSSGVKGALQHIRARSHAQS